jgi:hypothetical protein
MPRIVVIGGPRTGKTTYATKLARQLGVHLASTGKRTEHEGGLVSTDNYLDRGTYDDLPDRVIADLRKRDSFVLEGTQAARVVRRWLKQSPDEPRLDKALVFNRPWVKRNPRQESTAKGVRTTLRDLLPMLERAGIQVEHMTPPEMTTEDWAEHRREELDKAAESDAAEQPIDPIDEVVQDT